MDDIRRPQQPQRRDYTTPTPQRSSVSPPHQPIHHQPQHHQPVPQHHQPAQHHPLQPAHNQPTHNQPSHHQPAQPQPYHQSPHQVQNQPTAHYQPQAQPQHNQYQAPSQIAAAHAAQAQAHKPKRVKKSPVLKIITVFIGLITIASLIYFGYSLRTSTSGNGISQKIIQQAPFTVYFPSPMPPGYIYLKDSATFQIGQVFFKFGNVGKRVTVNEQPLPTPAPNINLPGYTPFISTIGKASVGATFGVSAGEVIAGKTLITLNTSGGVTQDELKTAINNLKVIGLSSDKKQ